MGTILFVRPPRHMWPWNSDSSAAWQPLGFAYMAAVLRNDGYAVEILDCLALHMGWKTLEKTLLEKSYDIICVGDETASAYESIKVIQFVKKHKPAVTTIGGGYFLPWMEQYGLDKWQFDFLIRGEGEQTLLELISSLKHKKEMTSYYEANKKIKVSDISSIAGLVYKKDGLIIINKERKPIDLNILPLPAYDLLPMECYGKGSSNHHLFAAIEHSRGCGGQCNFCSIESQYAQDGVGTFRSKTPERSFEETKLLVEKYNVKMLQWVDGTFNMNPGWSKKYFDLLKKNNIHVQHTAWVRADCIIRDERMGILKQMIDQGLVQIIIGMERVENTDHKIIGTKQKNSNISLQAFNILKRYPSIYVIASLIYGMPDDNWKELKQIKKHIYKTFVDFQFVLPYTPYPGTPLWQTYKDKFTDEDFRSWNLHRPVMGTKYLSRKQLDNWFKRCLVSYLFHPTLYKRCFFEKDKRKKQVQRSLALKVVKGLFQGILDVIRGDDTNEYGRKPAWYDS